MDEATLRFNQLISSLPLRGKWFGPQTYSSDVAYDPMGRGASPIKALLFEQTNDLTQLEEQISTGISNNVENIRVNSVNATQNNNEIYININYTINNQTDELTLALDINE